MKNYILDISDSHLVLFQFDEESKHYVQVNKMTMEKLFEMFDKLIESKCNIEEMHLNGNCLNMQVIYFFNDYLFKKEKLSFRMSYNLLNNETFKLNLYKRFNRFNAELKSETINNIASKRFDPENVRKRRLMATS